MIIETLDKFSFTDRLMKDGQFSREACQKLYDWYCEIAEDQGEPIKFDAVAIRCHWTEYRDYNDAWSDYNDTETLEEFRDWLESNTVILECEKSILVWEF